MYGFHTQALLSWCLLWHVRERLLAASPLEPPAQAREPARRLSYPSFNQPGPGESAALV